MLWSSGVSYSWFELSFSLTISTSSSKRISLAKRSSSLSPNKISSTFSPTTFGLAAGVVLSASQGSRCIQ